MTRCIHQEPHSLRGGTYVRAKSLRTYARAAGLHDWEDAHEYVGDISPNRNITPTLCSKILRQEFGRPQFVSLRWSLVLFSANDCKGKVQPINAQCETAAEEPMFRKVMRERRSRRLAFIKSNCQVAQIATS
jgi:putative SOS response-associated peptidase YedK